jgi:hypothetical protein
MSPGLVEEGGQTARTLITGLKHQPTVLALIIFNLVFAGAIFFSVQEQRQYNREIIGQLLSNAAKAEEMLFKCIQPRPTFEGKANEQGLRQVPGQAER